MKILLAHALGQAVLAAAASANVDLSKHTANADAMRAWAGTLFGASSPSADAALSGVLAGLGITVANDQTPADAIAAALITAKEEGAKSVQAAAQLTQHLSAAGVQIAADADAAAVKAAVDTAISAGAAKMLAKAGVKDFVAQDEQPTGAKPAATKSNLTGLERAIAANKASYAKAS